MSSPLPSNPAEFLRAARASGAVDSVDLSGYLAGHPMAGLPTDTDEFAARLVKDGLLTDFQAQLLLLGRSDNLTVGRYRLIDLLGRGGMGSVFLAADAKLDRRVAVKVLRPADRGGLVRTRFEREAQAAAAVSHPNVVRAFDYGEEDGLLFLVMEYVPGVDLQKLVWRRGPLPVGLACEYLRQAALGLHAVHSAGLVHRDVKPGNLMVDAHGEVKLLDLGLVRDAGPDGDGLTRAQGAGYVGTLEYLAPEQLTGSAPADPRADVFGLGSTLLYLLTARHPRDGREVPASPAAVLTQDLPRLRDRRADVPAALDELCAELTAREPDQRPASALAAAERLAAFADPTDDAPFEPPAHATAGAKTPVTPAARTPLAPTKVGGRRRRWLVLAAVAGAVVVPGVLLRPGQSVTEVPARVVPRAFVEVAAEWPKVHATGAVVTLSADGRVAATVAARDRVRVWDVDAGTNRPLADRPSAISTVALSPDGRRVVWHPELTTAVYANAADGAELGRVTAGATVKLAAAGNERFVAVDNDGWLHLWQPKTGTATRLRPTGETFSAAALVGGPGDRLTLATLEGRVLVYDRDTRTICAGAAGLGPVVFRLAAVGGDRIGVSDSRRLAVLRVYRERQPASVRVERYVPADEGDLQVTAVALSASGRRALTGYQGGARVWDLGTGRELFDLPLPGEMPTSAAVSADGTAGLLGLASGRILRLRLAGFD